MHELQVINHDGRLVTESREVAKMIQKRHSDLLRDIRGFKRVLDQNAKLRSANFFIASTYKNENNQEYPCFLLTKQGCEMVANKLTGKRGVLFTAAYVKKFNEMANHSATTPSNRKLLLETALAHEKKLESIESDVNYLKDSMRISGVQEYQINRLANQAVVKALGGKNTQAYKKMSNKVFARFWRDFKDYFTIPRYGELPKVKFEEAIVFIGAWQPDTSTRMEIHSFNKHEEVS